MAGTPEFVDVSVCLSAQIDWPSYKQWAASFDGIARIAIKATEGVGYQGGGHQWK